MADNAERPLIELFIDQQVFMDAVRGSEGVSEFSALTEITSFEQRGDDLSLEGNVLFTAYLSDSGDLPEDAAQPPMDAGDRAPATGQVEQVQHRMPFDLRMPVSAQDGGMLTVTVRVPDASMDILGPGWVHVRAVLEVEGLRPDGGYSARCGAQEATVSAEEARAAQGTGGPFQPVSPMSDAGAGALDVAGPLDAREESEAALEELEAALEELEASNGGDDGRFEDLIRPIDHPFAGAFKANDEVLEKTLGEPARAADRDQSVRTDPSSEMADWTKRLADSDRALHGIPHPFKTGRPPSPEEISKEMFDEASELWRVPDEGGKISKFHFEHANAVPTPAEPPFDEPLLEDAPEEAPENVPQDAPAQGLQSGAGEWAANKGGAPGTAGQEQERADEAQQPSREWEDPLLGLGGDAIDAIGIGRELVHAPSAGNRADAGASASEGLAFAEADAHGHHAEATAVQTSYAATPEEPVVMSAAEWFWKAMNIPSGETGYTMKFRIVRSTETIEEIANHYNVSVTELMRVNRVTVDVVEEGALLYIPAL